MTGKEIFFWPRRHPARSPVPGAPDDSRPWHASASVSPGWMGFSRPATGAAQAGLFGASISATWLFGHLTGYHKMARYLFALCRGKH